MCTTYGNFYQVINFSLNVEFTVHYIYTQKLSKFTPVSTIRILLDSFYQLISFVRNFQLEDRIIPKITPLAYIFQRPCLRGLFLEGLMYGGKFAFQN